MNTYLFKKISEWIKDSDNAEYSQRIYVGEVFRKQDVIEVLKNMGRDFMVGEGNHPIYKDDFKNKIYLMDVVYRCIFIFDDAGILIQILI